MDQMKVSYCTVYTVVLSDIITILPYSTIDWQCRDSREGAAVVVRYL